MLLYYGFDAKVFLSAFKRDKADWFYTDLEELKRQKGTDQTFEFGSMYPIRSDKKDDAGQMKGDYFHQDLYVARLIHQAAPKKHLDIGSRIDGFAAHVASFMEIELIDIRPIHSKVKNIVFRQADLMELPDDLKEYCDSVSSLHAIEHFGLGRYGDPVDYFGYQKALQNIARIVKRGGVFYFSVPIGPQRIEFNAHRVFSVEYLIEILSPDFEIASFSYVNDKGNFVENAALTAENSKDSFGCRMGCGIFTLIKK
jgi:SAM-dependent methyltransferase